MVYQYSKLEIYSGIALLATRILHEIWLLIGEVAIRRTKLTLNDGLGTKKKLLIEQYILLIGELLIKAIPLYIIIL